MIFRDRTEAGRRLAWGLRKYANREDVIVLAVPRGGVQVAFEVARTLQVPLEVFVVRKLGVPDREEFAFGAIASGGVRVLDSDIIDALGISDLDIELVTAAEKKELQRRERAYRSGRPSLALEGLTVILVDDGIATGSSMRAAISGLRQMNPRHIVVAVPVAPPAACSDLRPEVDELVCLVMPQSFSGVGHFYLEFPPVTDDEVNELLQRAAQPLAEAAK
jgi:putative phosphoribosyl transferase